MAGTITLSEEQQQCRAGVAAWDEAHQSGFGSPKQVYRVDGYAGTGKTSTIVKTVEELPGVTLFAAFTGKAALVMQTKGCTDATTLHKLVYVPAGASGKLSVDMLKEEIAGIAHDREGDDMSDVVFEDLPEVKSRREKIALLNKQASNPLFRLNPDSLLKEADRLVIDEVSMVGKGLGSDALSFGVPTLVLGDPGQLPPVKDEGFFTTGAPDFMLKEIHRQAAGSPILMLATRARQRQPLQLGTYGDSRVILQKDLTPEIALAANQILCGRNRTRHSNNSRLRTLLGYSGEIPMPGEKLVCLKNDHEKGFLNGSLWTVVRSGKYSRSKLTLTVIPEEGGSEVTVLAHSAFFTEYGRTEVITTNRKGDQENWIDRLLADEQAIGFDMREAQAFTFGYVLTVHKSQGSQWDKVLLIDESDWFKGSSANHLYTGCTRAAHQLVVAL